MKNIQRKSDKTTSVAESTNIVIKKHRKVKRWQCLTGVLAVAVLLCATYTMILPALTMEQQTYCGQEEHIHTDACYEQRLLCEPEEQHNHTEECYADVETCVCGQEETEGHTHSEECYAEDETCVCGMEETAGHTHDESCYMVQQELVCTVPEEEVSHTHTEDCYENVLVCDKEEHTHNLMCYSNSEADVESQEVWERSVSNAERTGIWADDLVAIAESQLGYTESENNYIVDEKGNIKGYSRYGAWYGDEYADWDAMFASFCLDYAGISSADMPQEASCDRWIEKLSEQGMYEEAAGCVPQKGDLIFFRSKENGTAADRVGIVSAVITDAEGTPVKVHTIEGDTENMVAERMYETNDSQIMGFGTLQKTPENTQTAAAAEAPETLSFADVDLTALTLKQLTALLEKITPEELEAYLESLSDEEYDSLMDNLSEEAQEILTVFLSGRVALLATGDTYVGFSRATADGPVDFADGADGGGGGVRKYYLAPYSAYYPYMNSTSSTLQKQLLDQSEVAYCFNYFDTTPYTVYESKTYPSSRPFSFYNEKESASASLFYNNTTNPRSGYSQTELYQKILTVAMNGYPNDYSGIRGKYNLTADEFRFITQYAVWYYTDSISLGFRIKTGQLQFCVNNDKTGECLTVHSYTYHGYYNASSSYIKAAYEELINSVLDTGTVNTSHINLYKPQNGSFQNLLTVGREDAPPPQQEPNRLKLTKTVSGTAGETDREFTFEIRLYNSSNSNLSGTYTVIPEAIPGVTVPGTTSITFSSGRATVKLKHGQSITIDGLPDNFRYTITETAEGNYTSTVTEGSDSNMSGVKGTAAVTFNNHKDAPPAVTKVQIPATKKIDNGQTAIGENRFKFKLTGNGEELYAESDENGNILFPEITYTQPGTYTYTVEEVTDERDGVTFDFDKSKKTVTVTINSQAVQTFDPDAVYYAFEELEDDNEYYYYVDTVPGNKGIVMYCTYQGVSGPQDPTGYSHRAVKDQTYRVVLNPTVSQITANNWVQKNIYGENLADNLKKLFYYFETKDAKNISNGDKQSLVWSATGKTSKIERISVNGKPASSDVTTVLNNIYETVNPPSSYNLAFFVPTGTQAVEYAQPLATGYGAQIDVAADEVVFNNTTKAQNSLKLGKKVSGTEGEINREFHFTISLMSNDFGKMSGTYTVISDALEGVEEPNLNSLDFVNGTASVSLKHGQSITVAGLPAGFYYTITEEEWNQAGYTSSVTKGTSSNMTSSGATGAVEVEFTNHKDAPPASVGYEAKIEATKTLDGEVPADGQFTFILKNAEGNEVARQKNNGEGKVIFPVSFDAPGTYTFTIEELNDHQENIVYDTEVKTVTVTVGATQLQEIVNGDSFVGSNNLDDFYITVNGTVQLDVYCIDGSAGYPSGNYRKVLDPTTAELENQVTANNYGAALSENLRKLLYYFDTHSYTDKVGYTTLTKVLRQELIWCLTGNPDQQHSSYTIPLNQILAESNPPDNYMMVMFASTNTPKEQPVIAGYLPKTEITYSAESGTAEFKNTHSYSLPKTGGIGTKRYVIGGLLLMGGALFLMCKTKLARKKEGKC